MTNEITVTLDITDMTYRQIEQAMDNESEKIKSLYQEPYFDQSDSHKLEKMNETFFRLQYRLGALFVKGESRRLAPMDLLNTSTDDCKISLDNQLNQNAPAAAQTALDLLLYIQHIEGQATRRKIAATALRKAIKKIMSINDTTMPCQEKS